MSKEIDLGPRITVFGVGGAGGNAVRNMIESELPGVNFVVCNTDAQALKNSPAPRRLQLGLKTTRGLGAGSRPEVGKAAAEETMNEILEALEGSNMVFITAGMGGGTGTGAAPVVARASRELGALTVGVVTRPFHFEGTHRMRLADRGIEEMRQHVDTLIIIPNQNLFRVACNKTTFADAFKMADDVLHSGVRGVTDLMVVPGLINLDFNDIRTVMSEMGNAMMGTGESTGEKRAIEAAEAAISNPLLDDVSMKGARGVLINVTGGLDMTLFEVDEAANRIREEVDPDANIIFGSTFDEKMDGRMRVSVVATGIEGHHAPVRNPATLAAVPSPAVQSHRWGGATAAGGIPGSAAEGQSVFQTSGSASPSPVQGSGYPAEAHPASGVQGDHHAPHAAPAAHRPFPEAPAGDPGGDHDLQPARTNVTLLKKRIPSLFSRFSGQRRQEQAVPAPADGTVQSVLFRETPAGATPRTPHDHAVPHGLDERDLDIPAFLRKR